MTKWVILRGPSAVPKVEVETPCIKEILGTETVKDFVALLRKYAGTKIKPYEAELINAHGGHLRIKECLEQTGGKDPLFTSCLREQMSKQ